MEKQQHFSIRKLSIGVASVLIGISFLGVQESTVKADSLQNASATELTKSKTANDVIKQDADSDIKQESTSNTDAKQITNDQPNIDQAPATSAIPKPNSNQQNTAIPETKPQEPAKTKLQTNGAITSDEANRTEVAATTLTTTTNKKLSANLLAESKVLSQANDTNGGFDEATWGTLDVNDWKGNVQGDYYQLTDYTGDANHVIVPNEADFTKAGISTSGKQVGVTSSLMHTIFRDKTTAQDATVAFSKTDNKQVKAIDNDWSNTWNAYDTNRGAKLSKFNGTNLDFSNVTDMSYMFVSNQISDLSPLANWKVDNVTDMDGMFVQNQISDLSPLVNWNVSNVTDMDGMFASNHISDLSPLANWKVDNVTDMDGMFVQNQISDLSPLVNWNVSNVTDMDGMFASNHISDLSPLANWKVDNVTNMDGMFVQNQISDLSPLANWKVSNVTDMDGMFDYNVTTQTKNFPAKRVINFVYPDGYTGKKQDSVTQTVNVPTKEVKVELTTKDSKPSNNILDWVTKTETPETPDPVYFQDYTVPEIKGLLEPDKTVISREQADITKPINVTVTYKLVESNTNDAFALDPKNGLHEHANVNNNGGYDEDYWGKLNINDWNYTANGDTITITGYKGNNQSSLIIPNGADFELANGQGTGQSNVEISSSVIHDLAKNATRIGLSKTANKKVAASDTDWSNAFGGETKGSSSDSSYEGIEVLNPNLAIMDLHNLDTSNITDMSKMFSGGTNLKTIGDLSNWNTSNVTDMSDMFDQASMTDIGDLSQWDTSKVTDMAGMFSFASLANIGNLSKWDTSKVTNMAEMFNAAMKLTDIGDLGQWDVSNVTDMYWMFYLASVTNIGNLSKWNTSKVTDMTGTFGWTPFLTDIGDLSKWDTSNVTGMAEMFGDTGLTNIGDLSKWDTSNVTNMANMFQDTKFTNIGDLSKWNTAKVTDMSLMFSRASKLTNIGDLGQWNTHNVTNMRNMFEQASNLTNVGDLSNWNTTKVTNMSLMFSQASKMTNIGDLSKWDTSNVTDMRGMFNQASNLMNIGDLSNWNTDKVTDVSYMFNDNEALHNLNISNWNLSNLTNEKANKKSLEYIFADDANLTVIANNITLPAWYDNELTNSNDFWNDHMAVITNNDKLLKATGDTDTLTIDNTQSERSIFYDSKGSSDAIKVLTDANNQYMTDYHKSNPTKFLKLADTVNKNDPIALANASFITVPAVNITVHFEDVDPHADKDSDTVKQELAKTVELSGSKGDAVDLSQAQLPTNFELSGDLPSVTFGDTDSVTIKLKHKLSNNNSDFRGNGLAMAITNIAAPDGTVLIQGNASIQSYIDQCQDLVTGETVDGATHWTYVTSSNTNVSSDILNKYIEQYNPIILDRSMNQSTEGWQYTLGGLRQPLQIKLKAGYTIDANSEDWHDSNNNGTYTWDGLKGATDWKTTQQLNMFNNNTLQIVPLGQSVHYQFMDNGTQVGSDITVTGKTDETVSTNLSIPENYELADGTTLPTSYTFAATNPTIQINLKHKTETSVESLSATRTINVHLPNGTTKVYRQIVGYQRDVITDLVTKTATRGKWNVNDVTSSFTIDGVKQLERSYVLRNGNYKFASIKLPKVPGYKAVIKTIPNLINPTSSLFTVSFMALPKPVKLTPNDVEPAKTTSPATTVSTETADLIKTDSKAATSVTVKTIDLSDNVVITTPKTIDLSDDAVATTTKEATWQVVDESNQDTYRVSNGKYTVELPHISNTQLHVIANDSTKDSVLFTYKGQNTKYVFNIKFVNGHYLLTTYEIKSNKLVKLIDYNFIKASKMSDLIRDWLKL